VQAIQPDRAARRVGGTVRAIMATVLELSAAMIVLVRARLIGLAVAALPLRPRAAGTRAIGTWAIRTWAIRTWAVRARGIMARPRVVLAARRSIL
jgi:hypothetical protein